MSVGLDVSDLVIYRRGQPRRAIGPLDFQVEQGSTLGIVGETGAGKTMALRALMGLLPESFSMSASVRIGASGAPLTDAEALRGQLGKAVGVVPQNPLTAFDPLEHVGSQVIEGVVRRGALTRGAALARAKRLLGEMGFSRPEDVMKLYPNQLSGGMAQRVSIVMAVMPEPNVVLADEPTSALDAVLRVGVLELLSRLTDESGSVLVLVSHDISLVARFCQRLIVMYGGRMVESGPADELLARPRHPYTRALLACTPLVGTEGRRALASIPGRAASLFDPSPGCRFADRCLVALPICSKDEPELVLRGKRRTACYVAEQEARTIGS
jgi:oligopeptide/dipeptide ABC transporter ATP-binding protein